MILNCKHILVLAILIQFSLCSLAKPRTINQSLQVTIPASAMVNSSAVMNRIFTWSKTINRIEYNYTFAYNNIGVKFETTTLKNKKELSRLYHLLANKRGAENTKLKYKDGYLYAEYTGTDSLNNNFNEQIIYINRVLYFFRCEAHFPLENLKTNTTNFFNYTLLPHQLAKSQFDKRSSLIFLIPILLLLFCLAAIMWYSQKLYKLKRLLK